MSHCPLTRSVTSLLFAVCCLQVVVRIRSSKLLRRSKMRPRPALRRAPAKPGLPGEPGAVQPGEENMEAGIPGSLRRASLRNLHLRLPARRRCPSHRQVEMVFPLSPSRVYQRPEAAPRLSGRCCSAGKDDQALESGPQAIRGIILGEEGRFGSTCLTAISATCRASTRGGRCT